MKNILIQIAITAFSFHAFSQKGSMAKDAGDYIGSEMNIVGIVTDIRFVKEKRGYTTYIQLGAKSFTQYLTLVASRNGQPRFSQIRSAYLHQYVHVRGTVVLHKGKPQIQIFNDSQIKVINEVPGDDVWPL